MNIVLTGSIGNVGAPLVKILIRNGHRVNVITSNTARTESIRALGGIPLIGSMFDTAFLTTAFRNADIVYLMETMDAAGDVFDQGVDFIGAISKIGQCYKEAIEATGVKRIVHLSSVGAHSKDGFGILQFHYNAESILRTLPGDVVIKFIRPVGFFTNLLEKINSIKTTGAIVSNYGGDKKEPWVHPTDIAEVIAEEMQLPFAGTVVRYVASDEISPNEIAAALGHAIGMPSLQWRVISDDQLLNDWLAMGFNSQVARGFVEMQASQGKGNLYEDYYQHRPVLGNVKLNTFATQFARAYGAQ